MSSKNLARGVWGERGRYKDVHGTAPALKKVILVGKVETSNNIVREHVCQGSQRYKSRIT